MNVKNIRRENARALATSVGGISKFALKLNKAQAQVSHIIGTSFVKNIGDKIAAQIEAAFDKPPGWLDREHYHIEKTQAVYHTQEGQSAILCPQIPLITWQEAKEWNQIGYGYKLKNNEQLLTTTCEVGPFAFALRVQGNSMESPYGISFPDGTLIVADPDEVAIPGSFVVLSIHPTKEATLKQLVTDGNKRYVKPLNPDYPIFEYTVGATIYGVVKQMIVDFIEAKEVKK